MVPHVGYELFTHREETSFEFFTIMGHHGAERLGNEFMERLYLSLSTFPLCDVQKMVLLVLGLFFRRYHPIDGFRFGVSLKEMSSEASCFTILLKNPPILFNICRFG